MAALYAIAAGTHELFSKFSSHPHPHATVRQFIHESLITNFNIVFLPADYSWIRKARKTER